MHPQKKRRELEKRRKRYQLQKEGEQQPKEDVSKTRSKIAKTLFNLKQHLKKSRSKMALWKLDFVNKLLARKNATAAREGHTFYKRTQTRSNVVENFLDKSGIDYPGQKGSSTPKKVLTKTMEALLKEFKTTHPSTKMSLTTFKRRRPSHILLSSSRKFEQCLCEKCTNLDLIIETINKQIPKGKPPLPSKCEDLVKQTLCA